MADTSHNTTEEGKLPTSATAWFVGTLVLIAIVTFLANRPNTYARYEPDQGYIAVASDLPAPVAYDGKVWVPVNDEAEMTGVAVPTADKVKGFTIYKPANPDEKAADTIYLPTTDGRLQPYVPQDVALASLGTASVIAVAAPVAGAPVSTAAPPPATNTSLPGVFRFRGYTWHQNSNAIQKDPNQPLMKIGSVWGDAIWADEPGPEAHRNSIYVEVRPGSIALQPYIPVEALYSTSNSANGDSNLGMGGEPDPYPTTMSPRLPEQVALDPTQPGAVVKMDEGTGAVTPTGATEKPPTTASKPNIAPTPPKGPAANTKTNGGGM